MMKQRKRFATRKLTIENLQARMPMAADLFEPGGSCPAVERVSLTSLESASKSTGGNAKAAPDKTSYSYSIVGDANDAVVQPIGGLALLGGGTDVDAAFAWMGRQARGGDFVVLSTTTNSYPSYISRVASVNSVASLVVPSLAAANNDFVAQVVASAEAIFIAGGDQSTYITNWTNTKLETAIYAALQRGSVLGGTSAGLAVLGDVDYAALGTSTTSAEALANPLTTSITLDENFITPDEVSVSPLNYLQETITDSHFMQRDRMGRTLAFMARADYENKVTTTANAIAINEQTALLIGVDGQASVVGNPYARKGTRYDQQRSVYLMSTTAAANLVAGQPLTYQAQVTRLNFDPITGTSDTFNFATKSNVGADLYSVTVASGVLSSSVGVYGPAIA